MVIKSTCKLVFHYYSSLETPFSALDNPIRHVGTEKFIPNRKERLRVVVLGALESMMDVMISGVVLEKEMEDVTGQPQPAVVIHGFDHRKAEEDRGCPHGHSRDEVGDGPTKRVDEETLERVVVEGPDRVRDNQSVVVGVYVTVQEFVPVHVSVQEVLPGVHDQHCYGNLQNLDWKRGLKCDS